MNQGELTNPDKESGSENQPIDESERPRSSTPTSSIDPIKGSASDPAELKKTFRRLLEKHGLPEAASTDEHSSSQEGAEILPEGIHLQQLRERLDAVQDCQAEMLGQFEMLLEAMERQRKSLLSEMGRLRRDLLDDRTRMASASVLHNIVPWLNSLRAMHHRTPPRQRALSRQLAATIDILRAMLQGLGFSEFHAQLGEPFDPARMECVGYAPGSPGIVLEEEHPGYCVGDTVFSPVGVYIADPKVQQKLQRDR